jgi:CHAT domain-containing protein
VDAKHWYWNGGSFALLVTPTRIDVAALDDEDRLESRLTVFLGLLSRRDALEKLGAASLYEDLLGPLLRKVDPSQTKRLIVVPDGTLHRLPFGALRRDPGSAPLASSYAISTVPSASLWYQQRRQGSAATRRSVLSLADPVEAPVSPDDMAASRRAELGPLPGARSEARAMTRSVGGSSRLLTGRSASERELKAADLRKVGVLHFATHAVVDSARPEQSAIVLAPGGGEDGLLHIREIVELELSRAIVILSACASASGELTEGEGVLGLAQAFFHAGAAAVISTQWPVRDDEAARFIHDVSAVIARGRSIGAAFDKVRRDWIARGEPTASWAGFVLMGDADATLAAPAGFARFGILPLAAVGSLLLGIVLWFVRRPTDR